MNGGVHNPQPPPGSTSIGEGSPESKLQGLGPEAGEAISEPKAPTEEGSHECRRQEVDVEALDAFWAAEFEDVREADPATAAAPPKPVEPPTSEGSPESQLQGVVVKAADAFLDVEASPPRLQGASNLSGVAPGGAT